MSSQENIDRNVTGNSGNNMKLVDLNSGKTVIALVPKNSGNILNSTNGEGSLPSRGVNQSPRSSAINLVQRSPAIRDFLWNRGV